MDIFNKNKLSITLNKSKKKKGRKNNKQSTTAKKENQHGK